MNPDFTIVTQRLTLRLIGITDANAFASLISDSYSLHKWMDWTHRGFTPIEAKEFILSNRINWVKGIAYGFGVYLKESDTLIGMVAISEFQRIANMADIGYWIGDRYQRNGYCKEALDALAEFCFSQVELTRLEIVCDPENIPSHIIALKCGAEEECLAKNRYIFNGKPRNGLVFSITP